MEMLMKVWPLRPDLPGCDALGNPLILTPGLAGWMSTEAAQAADAAGEVQIMAGLRPTDLKQPSYSAATMKSESSTSTSRTTKKRTYRRRDMRAEKLVDNE